MSIRFTKMHGLGNDFIVIDAINQSVDLTSADIARLSRRDTGIGFDQCLLIEASTIPNIDFFYRIFNANGQEVGQCGNGARCLARFAVYYGLTSKPSFTVATHTTQMLLHINPDDTITIDFGRPQLSPISIPLQMPNQAPQYSIPLKNGMRCDVHALSVGNPHAIMIVSDLTSAPVDQLGRAICEHPLFPEQTNVEFVQLVNLKQIKVRVYERGCGETQACGSGAVAAAAACQLYHGLNETVSVQLPGGDLDVKWPNKQGSIFLTGPAEFVYEGKMM